MCGKVMNFSVPVGTIIVLAAFTYVLQVWIQAICPLELPTKFM